jgi:hypothetical protein
VVSSKAIYCNPLGDEGLVGIEIHQVVQLVGVRQLDLVEPAVDFRAFVERRGVVCQCLVGLDDFTVDRSIDFGRGLDRLDDADFVAFRERVATVLLFDIDDLAKLLGRVGRNADRGGVAFNSNPFVFFGLISGHVGLSPISACNFAARKAAKRFRQVAPCP